MNLCARRCCQQWLQICCGTAKHSRTSHSNTPAASSLAYMTLKCSFSRDSRDLKVLDQVWEMKKTGFPVPTAGTRSNMQHLVDGRGKRARMLRLAL